MSIPAQIYALMADLVGRIWYVPAFLLAGYTVLSIVNAVKRGSGV